MDILVDLKQRNKERIKNPRIREDQKFPRIEGLCFRCLLIAFFSSWINKKRYLLRSILKGGKGASFSLVEPLAFKIYSSGAHEHVNVRMKLKISPTGMAR